MKPKNFPFKNDTDITSLLCMSLFSTLTLELADGEKLKKKIFGCTY